MPENTRKMMMPLIQPRSLTRAQRRIEAVDPTAVIEPFEAIMLLAGKGLHGTDRAATVSSA